MNKPLDADEMRYRLEERWKHLGYDRLLPEEHDFILTWWLEVEASNGSLHQYFSNSTGDSAIDALTALKRLGARNAANVLHDAISLFDGPYPTDREARNDALNEMSDNKDNGDDIFDLLTDRLFDESEDVRSLALKRVGDAYIRDQISDIPPTGLSGMRVFAIAILAVLVFSVVGLLVMAMRNGG